MALVDRNYISAEEDVVKRGDEEEWLLDLVETVGNVTDSVPLIHTLQVEHFYHYRVEIICPHHCLTPVGERLATTLLQFIVLFK